MDKTEKKFYDVRIPAEMDAADSVIIKIQVLAPGVCWSLHDEAWIPFIRFWATDEEWNKLVCYLNGDKDTGYYFE